jgi:adenylyltransferase/sulfurtransferase
MSIIQDFLRYNRQVILPEIGDEGQEVKKATVLVIGAGGLGCPVYNI